MTQLKTKSGVTEFKAVIETVEGITLHKEAGKVIAKLDGTEIGEVRVTQVWANGKEVKVSSLVGDIDVQSLIGKDPTTLTQEELIALTTYLQGLSAAQVTPQEAVEEEAAKAPKGKTKTKPAPVVEEADEDEDEEEEEAFELPEGLDTYEAIAALGVKVMWAEIGKHIAAEAGIKARTPKDEMLEAIAEYFELEPAEDEEEEAPAPAPKAKGKAKAKPAPVEEDEDEEDDEEFEDDVEEDDEDEDDIDEDDIDEDGDDEDDEDYEEDDIDEDDEEEDEDVTEEDVDALFEAGNKAAIVAFCKQHDITIPKKKLSAATMKQIILEELFGDE